MDCVVGLEMERTSPLVSLDQHALTMLGVASASWPMIRRDGLMVLHHTVNLLSRPSVLAARAGQV